MSGRFLQGLMNFLGDATKCKADGGDDEPTDGDFDAYGTNTRQHQPHDGDLANKKVVTQSR